MRSSIYAHPDRVALGLGLAAYGLLGALTLALHFAAAQGIDSERVSVFPMSHMSPSDAMWSGLAFASSLTAFGAWCVAASATVDAVCTTRGRLRWFAVALNFSLPLGWVSFGVMHAGH